MPKQEKKQTASFQTIWSLIDFLFLVILPIVFLYCWVYFVAEPELIYHKQIQPFFIDLPYIREFLNRPNGVSELFSAFMLKFYGYGVTGILNEIILISAVSIAGWFVLNKFGKSNTNKLIFLAPAFTVFFHIDYNCLPFPALAGAISGLLCFMLLIHIYALNRIIGFLLFAISSSIILWCFTVGFLLFFLLCSLYAINRNRKPDAIVFVLISGGWVYLFFFHYGFKLSDFELNNSLFGRLAEIAIVFLTPIIIIIRKTSKILYEKGIIRKVNFKIADSPLFYGFVSAPLCLAIFSCGEKFFDWNKKYLIQVDYYACKHQWQTVIDTFAKLKSYNNIALVQLRRALLYTDRLLDDYFYYPQLKEKYFFPDYNDDVTVCMTLAEFFYELGHINFSEHLCYESLEYDGAKPRQLILLSKINLLKGKTNAAKIFLNRLSRDPFSRNVAMQALLDIQNNSPFKNDDMFKFVKEYINTVPYAGYEIRDETFFNQLLVSNPKNRRAFECLIATYLANKNLSEAMRLVNAFPGLGFKNLPRHYEEAVLVWQIIEKHQQFVPGKYRISQATTMQFNDFVRVIERYNGNLAAAKSELAERFGTTYWYYYFYEEVFNPFLQFYKPL
ncbi:MAG: DUF6057 family protein [Verrucomicrobiia bacterium]